MRKGRRVVAVVDIPVTRWEPSVSLHLHRVTRNHHHHVPQCSTNRQGQELIEQQVPGVDYPRL